MSSSSSPASVKRKRGDPVTTAPELQPSSRDASGEELAAGGGPAPNTRHRKNNPSADLSVNLPPSKRARTRSSAAASTSNVEEAGSNKSEPTADSEETPKRRQGRSASSASKTNGAGAGKDDGDGERELDETERRMAQPPRGGLRDPIGGYKTNPPPIGRAVRVYADGVFDLFHLGHMRQLQQAKTAFPNTYLIVGVTGNTETHRRKGLTVLTGQERAETVRHCKWVDEVIPNCPWIVTPEFLAEHNIDYVAHDDEPYGAAEGDDIYAPIKKEGKFLVTERTEGVSTTGIITKIVRDYEKYIARQLKRGTSRQELNVSWLKKNELDLKRHVQELRESIKQNWTSAGGEIGRDLKTFWTNAGLPISRPQSPAPSMRRTLSGGVGRDRDDNAPLKSPTTIEHLKHLDVPGRSESPGGRLARSEDFAAGYSLGLLGSVRSWMTRTRRSLRESQANSPYGSEDEDLRSPTSEHGDELASEGLVSPTVRRGRSGNAEEIDAMDTVN